MRKIIILSGVVIVAIVTAIAILQNNPIEKNIQHDIKAHDNFEEYLAKQFTLNNEEWVRIESTSVFTTYVRENDYTLVDGKRVWNQVLFELDPAIDYQGAMVQNDQKSVVIFPTFTASAYSEPGFYSYYRNECGQQCLTVKIQNRLLPQANPNAVQILRLLGYDFTTDVHVDRDPSILLNYDKVVLLHNEYVTKKEFDAITSHPNVIYLYPNALYAEIQTNYEEDTITLIRGHNYPLVDIKNGFDWEFDNTDMEYDTDCQDMEFYKISNGWMLSCYPENVIHKNLSLLEAIRKLES